MKECSATYPFIQAVEEARDLSTVSYTTNLCESERRMIGVPFPGKTASCAGSNQGRIRKSPQSRRRPHCSPKV